jgi:hypothetical protein
MVNFWKFNIDLIGFSEIIATEGTILLIKALGRPGRFLKSVRSECKT